MSCFVTDVERMLLNGGGKNTGRYDVNHDLQCCPKCTNLLVAVRATAFGDEYKYCRTCKKELKELMLDTQK